MGWTFLFNVDSFTGRTAFLYWNVSLRDNVVFWHLNVLLPWDQDFTIMMTPSNGNIFHVADHLSPVNSPHKGQWCRALMFSLIWARINGWHGWVNNRKAGDLRRHRAHYDMIVMSSQLALRRWPNVGPTSTLTLGQRRLTNVGPTWICQLAQRWPNGCTPTLAQRCANIGPTLAH